ncbi:hypothetical protein BH10ACI2_BH10ACI2_15940 [soil metagenome]
MPDVDITFEREGLHGIVAVGTYLSDAAKRFGVVFEAECDRAKTAHLCSVIVKSGSDLLSPLTKAETEHFGGNGRRSNERLACEASIIKPGEIVIMTDQKTDEAKAAEAPKDTFQEEFEALPLEKKIARLLKMEAITLGETFSYVVNSPFKVVEKVGDVIAEFGMKIENEARKAAKPPEAEADKKTEKSEAPKAKTQRKSASSKSAKSPEA